MRQTLKRLLEISYKHKLSHIGSCLTALPILEYIYTSKFPEDKVILSAGHAGLAQYVVLEKEFGFDAEEMLKLYGIHPIRDLDHGIYVSSGSLGSAILVATGIAKAEKLKKSKVRVHVIISDGESAEGSVWEALNFIEKHNIDNLILHANLNGYSAYDQVDLFALTKKLTAFKPDIYIWYKDVYDPELKFIPEGLKGLSGHYHVLTEEEYLKMIGEENA